MLIVGARPLFLPDLALFEDLQENTCNNMAIYFAKDVLGSRCLSRYFFWLIGENKSRLSGPRFFAVLCLSGLE